MINMLQVLIYSFNSFLTTLAWVEVKTAPHGQRDQQRLGHLATTPNNGFNNEQVSARNAVPMGSSMPFMSMICQRLMSRMGTTPCGAGSRAWLARGGEPEPGVRARHQPWVPSVCTVTSFLYIDVLLLVICCTVVLCFTVTTTTSKVTICIEVSCLFVFWFWNNEKIDN
ncbi:hypothetical protein EDB86DRAFT_1991079 [Lactarius hatsudake]|nr:hypothetical protein EDB86DRAFT_1991079 [Lactarius hatsudake]